LLSKTVIQEILTEKKVQRSERLKVDSDYVLNRLVEIDQMDVLAQQYVITGNGSAA